SKGQVRLRGKDITRLPPDEIVGLGIGHVPEGRRIFHRMSVRDNLILGAYQRKDREGIRRDQEHVLTLFPRVRQRLNQIGGTLSGGEQQMLAIARGLMSKPKVLLLVSCTPPQAAPSGPVLASIAVGSRPGTPAVGLGAVWIPNTGDGTVSRIDPASNRVVATLRVGDAGAFYQRVCQPYGSVHSFMVTTFHVRRC